MERPTNLLLALRESPQHLGKVKLETQQMLFENAVAVYDPYFWYEQGAENSYPGNVVRNGVNRVIALQYKRVIKLFNLDEIKQIKRLSANEEQNQLDVYRQPKLEAVLRHGYEKDFKCCVFYNFDAKLLFAGTAEGFFSYFDVNVAQNENRSVAIQLSRLSTHPILSLDLPPNYQLHNLCAVSFGEAGLKLFDIRQNKQSYQSAQNQSVKSKFFPENCNLLCSQTIYQTLELYDVRKMVSPVQIYGNEYQEFAESTWLREKQEEIWKKQMDEEKRLGSQLKKKRDEKEFAKQMQKLEQASKKQIADLSRPREPQSCLEKMKPSSCFQRKILTQFQYRKQAQPALTDFDFMNNAQIMSVNCRGEFEIFDMLSGCNETNVKLSDMKKISNNIDIFAFAEKQQEDNYKLTRINDKGYQYLINTSQDIYAVNLSDKKYIGLSQMNIARFNNLILEDAELDLNGDRKMKEEARGGFLVTSSEAGLMRYQVNQKSR